MPDASWSKAPGPTVIPRRAVVICNGDWNTNPKVIQDIRGKAQVRLCTRYRRLVARGKHAHVVTVAMARELTGCMWAMAKEVPVIA
jgi:hypothetical protein